MRRLAFLLRPSWLALYVVVVAFAYLCFTVLAPWQLGKNTRTSRENSQISHSLTAAPVPLTTFLPHQDSSAPDAQWRRVTATGHYLPDAQVLARLRVIDGDPAFEVLVPFAVDGGPVVLVDRGYVRPVAGSDAPTVGAAPTTTVTITARLRDSEPVVQGKDPFREGGAQQVYSINTEQDLGRHGRAAGAIVCSTGRESARRPRRHQPAPPRRRSVPFVRHPVDRVRHRGPDSGGLLRVRRGCAAPTGEGRLRRTPPTPRSRPSRSSPTDTAGGAERRPRRPAAASLHCSRQPHRPREIRYLGNPAIAEGRPDLEFVCVLRRTAEPHAERSGERGLHHTRVGAGVTGRVAAPRTQRFGGRPADQRRAHRHQQGATRAATKLAASSKRAAAQPNRAYRGEKLPIIASSVLAPRYTSTAGTPPAAAHNAGATWASEVFSATDSSAARARPGGSSAAGSRPHSDGSSRRAAATSPASSRAAIWSPMRPNDVPPSETYVAAAVAAAVHPGPRRAALRSTVTPSTPSAPSSAAACSAPARRESA